MTLYELTGEWQQVLSMMEDPDVPEEAVRDTLEGLSGEIEEKADGYAIYGSLDGINFARYALIEDGSDTKHRLKSLTPGRIYYFRIHPYVEAGDHVVYSSSSNVRATLVLR